jgi:DNA damage-binding protein 1
MTQQLDTKGCVYSLEAFESDKIVAGINSKVELFQWDTKTDPQNPCLTSLCAHYGYIVALTLAVCGSFIIVGDLMKSVSVLTYNPTDNKLKESYRDYATNWMTAVEAIDQDHFIGADHNMNLFTLKKHIDEREVNLLVEDGQFHVGEMIHHFRHGEFF